MLRLTDEERIGLKQVLANCRHLEATAAHVTAFAEMLTERRAKPQHLDGRGQSGGAYLEQGHELILRARATDR